MKAYKGSGSVYIYEKDDKSNEWNMKQKFVPSDAVYGNNFGAHVAIYGNIVVVGADGDDDNGEDSGSVNMYQ